MGAAAAAACLVACFLLGPEAEAAAAADASVTALGDLASATGEETATDALPSTFEKIYRVYGDDSRAGGASWSPVNPGSVANYRDAAGLPSGGASGATNTGRFVIEGDLLDPTMVVLRRNALPLDGMQGGIPEYIIPDWMENGSVRVTRVSGVNPEF